MLSGAVSVVEADETNVGARQRGKRGIPGHQEDPSFFARPAGRQCSIDHSIYSATTSKTSNRFSKNTSIRKLIWLPNVVYYFSRDRVPKHPTVNHAKKKYVRSEGAFSHDQHGRIVLRDPEARQRWRVPPLGSQVYDAVSSRVRRPLQHPRQGRSPPHGTDHRAGGWQAVDAENPKGPRLSSPYVQ
jgi:hypothetical protein